MKAEMRVMLLHTKEYQRLPKTHKMQEKDRIDSPSQSSDRTNPANTMIPDSWPPEW
jgi:hypothetical protein